jgi:dTDP-4-dehydrorhamnose 3,5-epimerase
LKDNALMLPVPPGFAHGFVALNDKAHVVYKCTCEYERKSWKSFPWDDPAIGISRPTKSVIISMKGGELAVLRDRPRRSSLPRRPRLIVRVRR